MPKILIIFSILLFFQNVCFAKNYCTETDLYYTAIMNNVLNLTEEQTKLKSQDCKAFKKCLTDDQRIKYNMIKKLEKDDLKKTKKPKNYYKSNPQMQPFGNP